MGLRNLLDKEARGPPPAYIVLHLGANDIATMSSYKWRTELEVVVMYLRVRYPTSTLVWSDMITRRNWRNEPVRAKAEEKRARNQLRARAVVRKEGGASIRHNAIKCEHLARDGVHLSQAGQDIFRRDLEDGIIRIMGIMEHRWEAD